MFLNDEQQQLANDIAERLIARGETLAVAESTSGGLVSAALLAVAGASRYYAGGGVLYTLNSRTALAGVPAETYANYRGTTPEMLATLAEAMRERLGATWCIAESGVAGPGPGRFETGLSDRQENMVEFATRTLRYLRDALQEADA